MNFQHLLNDKKILQPEDDENRRPKKKPKQKKVISGIDIIFSLIDSFLTYFTFQAFL